MKTGLFIVGIVLLIIGLVLFGSGANTLSAIDSCLSSTLCTLGAALDSSQIQAEATSAHSSEIWGIILTVIGGALAIAGFVGKEQQLRQPTPPQIYPNNPQSPQGTLQQQTKFFCAKCGNRSRYGSQFCENCGATI